MPVKNTIVRPVGVEYASFAKSKNVSADIILFQIRQGHKMSSKTINIADPEALGMDYMPLGTDFYKNMFDALYDGVYFVDTQRRIMFWNKGAEQLTGYSKAEVMGSFCYENILQHTDENGCNLCHDGCPLVNTIASSIPSHARVYLLHKDKRRIAIDVHVTPLRDDQGRIIGAVEIFRDASAAVALEKAYTMMRETAQKDHLTGIANRRQMDRTIDDQLALLKRTGIQFNIIVADIDNFKEINDSMGHAAGDKALFWFSQLVQQQCRTTDLFARMGGDEFLLLLRQQRMDGALKTAERIRSVIENTQAEQLQGRKLTASFGIAEANLKDTRQTLLERADKALYQAKAKGKNRVESA